MQTASSGAAVGAVHTAADATYRQQAHRNLRENNAHRHCRGRKSGAVPRPADTGTTSVVGGSWVDQFCTRIRHNATDTGTEWHKIRECTHGTSNAQHESGRPTESANVKNPHQSLVQDGGAKGRGLKDASSPATSWACMCDGISRAMISDRVYTLIQTTRESLRADEHHPKLNLSDNCHYLLSFELLCSVSRHDSRNLAPTPK